MIPENGNKDGRNVKVLVEVDLLKPLIRGTKLRCNGEERWVEFKYENLPLFCFYCGMVGHGDIMCGRKKKRFPKIRFTQVNLGSGYGW